MHGTFETGRAGPPAILFPGSLTYFPLVDFEKDAPDTGTLIPSFLKERRFLFAVSYLQLLVRSAGR